MSKKKQIENNYVQNKLAIVSIIPIIVLLLQTPCISQSNNSVNMKNTNLKKAGNQGGVFYATKKFKNVSKHMHPNIQSPQEIVNNEWESVTYSPEETYIRLGKKNHPSYLSKPKKKLSFSEVAKQF